MADTPIAVGSKLLSLAGYLPTLYIQIIPMDLITLNEYKALNAMTSVKEDERLNLLVPSISQLIKNYCNNPILDYYSSEYTENFDIQWSTYTVQLRLSPINVVTSVGERLSPSDAYTTLVAGTDYWIDSISDSIFRINEAGRYQDWPVGAGAVQVIYKAGYSTTPTDLKLAVSDLITYYLKDERKDRRALGAASIDYAPNSNDGSFPDYIKRVLDIYKL
jgi:hypothetical protein